MGDTTTEDETGTDICSLQLSDKRWENKDKGTYTSSDNRETVLLERAVNSTPPVARSDSNSLLVRRKGDLIQVLECNGDAALDAGCTRESGMTTPLDRKRTRCET